MTESMNLSPKTICADPALAQYMIDTAVRETPLQRALREETARMPRAQMQIGPDQGAFMALLTQIMRAKRYLEIGVFTGYSALAVALALPEDGQIVACDVSEEYTAVARRYWAQAGVASKIDLRLAPALQTLDQLLSGGAEGSFDLAFIDADKENVDAYYERVLRLLRPGGLMLVDNVLWDGKVLDAQSADPDTRALRAIAQKAGRDDRVETCMLGLCDGILMAYKR